MVLQMFNRFQCKDITKLQNKQITDKTNNHTIIYIVKTFVNKTDCHQPFTNLLTAHHRDTETNHKQQRVCAYILHQLQKTKSLILHTIRT